MTLGLVQLTPERVGQLRAFHPGSEHKFSIAIETLLSKLTA